MDFGTLIKRGLYSKVIKITDARPGQAAVHCHGVVGCEMDGLVGNQLLQL